MNRLSSLIYFVLIVVSPLSVLAEKPDTIRVTSLLDFPRPTEELKEKFNRETPADMVQVKKIGGFIIEGFATENQKFLEEVVRPALQPQLDKLKALPPQQQISHLALFGYEVVRVYFGEPTQTWEFYRWGGDLFDLDDPQEAGRRFDKRYGLDCSGLVALPFELAVYFDLMKAEDPAAVFGSQGFAQYCQKHQVEDKGGRGGTSNRFRVDSSDMSRLGREVFSVPLGESVKKTQLKKLQPGDVISGPGHVGILVDWQGELHYIESGVTVIGENGHRIVPAEEGLNQFARDYPVSVRRSLPDKAK